jgi:hypothetical protein
VSAQYASVVYVFALVRRWGSGARFSGKVLPCLENFGVWFDCLVGRRPVRRLTTRFLRNCPFTKLVDALNYQILAESNSPFMTKRLLCGGQKGKTTPLYKDLPEKMFSLIMMMTL